MGSWNRGGIQTSLCLPLFGRDREFGRQWACFLCFYLQAVHKHVACFYTCALSSACMRMCVCVCVLTGAGHGRRIAISPKESRVTVTDSCPVSEWVAVWRTLRASCVWRLGFVKPSRAGWGGDKEKDVRQNQKNRSYSLRKTLKSISKMTWQHVTLNRAHISLTNCGNSGIVRPWGNG